MGEKKKRGFFSRIWSTVKRHKVIFIIILLLAISAIVFLSAHPKKKIDETTGNTEAVVSRMSLAESISGNSVIEANDEYTVVPLVTGEILRADFEEGDKVQKDQVLYEIDSSDAMNSIKSSNLSIQKAENSSSDARDSIDDLNVTAPFTGTVAEVYVSVGDDVSPGTKIADIIDTNTIKATIPFNASDAENISSGELAYITLVENGNVLEGRVVSVSSGSQTTGGNMKISYVTIEVSNPGAISEGSGATAMVGEYACNDVGSFEAMSKKTVTSKVNGTIIKVAKVKGDKVAYGESLAKIESESVNNQVRNADISLQEAYLQREKLYDQLDNYTIKAPISGTVVRKNKKAGDKIEGGNASESNVLAVIYDMSSLCFELSVDELDIKKMAVGQEVTINADAVEDRAYKGIVENVSINGTIGTNGVTTYPVKIRITDFDENLLPGMNIEASIVVNKSENTLVVPVNAVNRGNTVYVKGEKTDEKDRAPEGYKTVQVETGISNDMFVEIISGLNEGDSVYVTPSAGGEQQMMFPGMGGMSGMGGMPGGNRPGGMPGGGGMR
ncbi:MAG: HlyD family efflux transporter periplasmic adaptor subunit [Clostridia bacterium]|nr:HlyD family efflux transporter periplasmic adaptor subunit [Clostridia bacterium]